VKRGECRRDGRLRCSQEINKHLARITHAAHVRVAWWYLRQAPLPEALARFSRALRRFAAAQGAADKYHETITVAWMALVAERLQASPDLDWDAFAARYPELLVRTPSILARYYSDDCLRSPIARRTFVLPDWARQPPGW
jgi:hypothetical protein